MLPAGVPARLVPPGLLKMTGVATVACCAARVSPDGNLLSGVLNRNGVRAVRASCNQASYAPVVSAIPRTKGVIWLHVVAVAICDCTAPLQPVTVFTWITKSDVIPFVASAIIAAQSAAARSVGLRPSPARNFAL